MGNEVDDDDNHRMKRKSPQNQFQNWFTLYKKFQSLKQRGGGEKKKSFMDHQYAIYIEDSKLFLHIFMCVYL